MLRVISRSKIWFSFSGILAIASIALFSVWGLRLGIDFRGGSLSELEFEKPVSPQELERTISQSGLGGVIVQPVSEKTLIVKTEPLPDGELTKLRSLISEKFGSNKELSFESIGPTISRELLRKAYWQIALVVVGILLYISYAFRNAGQTAKKAGVSSWRMGVSAIVALVHDLLITVGFFVVLGKYRGVEVDSLFITALLTILGFSVHDTIVVFDRIRENLQKFPYKSLEAIIDYATDSTLARSINTSFTLMIVLVSMLFFGGQTIFNFVLALLFGVTIGTYSSIFNASPILFYWSKFALKK